MTISKMYGTAVKMKQNYTKKITQSYRHFGVSVRISL